MRARYRGITADNLIINGNKYLLTFQDNLTKFSKAIPIPNQKINTIAKEFVTKFANTEYRR